MGTLSDRIAAQRLNRGITYCPECGLMNADSGRCVNWRCKRYVAQSPFTRAALRGDLPAKELG